MTIKPGRLPAGETRAGMRQVTFRVDEETWQILCELEKGEGPNIRGRRSRFLRKLIHAAKGTSNGK